MRWWKRDGTGSNLSAVSEDGEDQQYYQKAFEVTGQNGFEEILAGKLRKLIRQMMKIIKITLQKLEGLRDINIFLEFHTLTVVNGLKYWLTSRKYI